MSALSVEHKFMLIQFEKHKVKDGCDMYGYSFEYDTGDYSIEFSRFIRLGKTNMVEVIGVRKKEPNTVLLNTIRYVAASFIDYGEPSNVSIGGGISMENKAKGKI